MKKIFLLSGVVILAAIFSGCTKNYNVINPPDNNHWLSQERGDVVYSDSYCNYYVVETDYGYTIIRAMSGSHPYEGDIMFGNFGSYGTRQFLNYSAGYTVMGQVVEVDLSYFAAQDALDYYCPTYYGKSAKPVERIKNSGKQKQKRTSL